MKQLLTSFAAYDFWANERLLQSVSLLNEAQQQQEVTSSFDSIYKTCLHIWDASSLWWQRMNGVPHENIVAPSLSFHPTMQEVIDGLLLQNRQWSEWVKNKTIEELQIELSYKSMKGDAFTQPVHEILLHLFNHGTYHRGQLVTLLRQAGVDTIPSTDFIVWTRVA